MLLGIFRFSNVFRTKAETVVSKINFEQIFSPIRNLTKLSLDWKLISVAVSCVARLTNKGGFLKNIYIRQFSKFLRFWPRNITTSYIHVLTFNKMFFITHHIQLVFMYIPRHHVVWNTIITLHKVLSILLLRVSLSLFSKIRTRCSH